MFSRQWYEWKFKYLLEWVGLRYTWVLSLPFSLPFSLLIKISKKGSSPLLFSNSEVNFMFSRDFSKLFIWVKKYWKWRYLIIKNESSTKNFAILGGLRQVLIAVLKIYWTKICAMIGDKLLYFPWEHQKSGDKFYCWT